MKICTIPLDIAYASVEDNLLTAAKALNDVERDTDVVVLPELFTTSFVPDQKTVSQLAEPNDGRTVAALRRWAEFFGFAIAGSFLATDGGGRYFNRGFFMEPGGEVTFYDKRHLFPLSTEDKVYTPGREMPARIRYRGCEFMLVLCFDLRFPVWTRNRPESMYDVLIVPANWPHSRAEQLKTLLAARAIENQAYVIVANCSGSDKYGEYKLSDSGMYDNLGVNIQETRRNGYHYALLDLRALAQGRARFPAYAASDKWSIELP